MTLTLEIPPEVQRELVREAEARGVAVPALAARLLEEAVARSSSTISVNGRRSPLQIRAWLDSLTEFSDLIPALRHETFSRATIYDSHD
jgi:hypothetical protein